MNQCQNCKGTGQVGYNDDPSPSGVSLSPGTMVFTNPCPNCLEKGLCPGCGQTIGEHDNCKCGWVFDEEVYHLPTDEGPDPDEEYPVLDYEKEVEEFDRWSDLLPREDEF